MVGRLRSWVADERGANLVEYMLLASFIGIVGWLGIQALETAMNTSYQSWDSQTQSIWEPPPPTP